MIENRLDQSESTDDLVELLSGHCFSIGYGPGARAVAMLERVEGYLESGRFNEAQMGRLHLLGALAGIAALRPERIAFHAGQAVARLRSTGLAHDLAMAHLADALPLASRAPSAAQARLDEAAALAEATEAPAIANYALAYRAFVVLSPQGQRGPSHLDSLAERLRGTPYDAAHSVYLQARVVEQFLDAPADASATCELMRTVQGRLGVPYTEAWQLQTAITAANLGDPGRAAVAIEGLRTEYRRNGHDGLPDLLLPLVVLAWRLGDTAPARRWLTAMRFGGGGVANFGSVGIYRNLRAVIGLEAERPRTAPSLAAAVAEALTWLQDVAGPEGLLMDVGRAAAADS